MTSATGDTVRGPVTVAIVNDYEVVVTGLSRMLKDYPDRVAVVDAQVGHPAPRSVDVALYDTFGQPLGPGVGERLRPGSPLASRLVIYSWTTDAGLVEEALAAGADGFVAKQAGAEELVTALERVAAGEQVRPGPAVAGSAADDPTDGGDWPGRQEGLSPRESEVLALIVRGLTNEEVAAGSRLAVNTVKTYVGSAYRKMGVASRSQAVLWGIDHGFRLDQSRGGPSDGG